MTNDATAPNYAKLRAWVDAQLAHCQLPEASWQALSGDAGFRRYFRLASGRPLLAVYAPPATENNRAFVGIAQYLRDQGLAAPAVLAVDYDQGFLLVEDLGADLYLPQLTASTVDAYYQQAMASLLRLQQLPVDAALFPPYDAAKLRLELEVFPQWFIGQLLDYTLNADEQSLLLRSFQLLEQTASRQPQRIVHRDFHSRNLLVRKDAVGNLMPPGLIDFQDALCGPITYDLVSLLRDCYIHWPRAQVERWVLQYQRQAQAAGLLPQLREGEFLRWFDWMGLQRHLKVLGVFARLSLRDGKHGYLQDLPLVLAYTLAVARRYREFSPLAAWMEQQLLPRIVAQPWYRPLVADL